MGTSEHVARVEQWSAHNYSPLPVVIEEAEGAWAVDVEGKRYLDLLAGYSALNFGHRHPHIVQAAAEQLGRVTLTSRAFLHDRFAEFCQRACELVGKEAVVPMNSGAEAVETALKLARKWGRDAKGVEGGRVVTFEGNFHGRTTTIVSFSTDEDARSGFGPHTPGFTTLPYGDAAAVERAVTDPEVVAVLLEPVQGEAGVVVPPPGYLRAVREACTRAGVLLVADEIQSGLGRTGHTLACEREDVQADVYALGKALGGGILPVSAVLADRDVMDVLTPGTHGSTFGGNPLACAVAIAAIELLTPGDLQTRAVELGEQLRSGLEALEGVRAVRSVGLWAGIDVDEEVGTGREVCEMLLSRGVLAKEAHGQTIRLAPPLVITEDDLAWGIEQLSDVLSR